jgi:hypothetical protein
MPYTGFNSFPSLPDKYAPPPVDDEKNSMYALKHCLPSIPEIVQKIRATADNSTERVYVLTNASREWLEELVRAVKEAHPWAVSTSRDLALSWEAKFVSGALDMYVASRAEKFIGNGVRAISYAVQFSSSETINDHPVFEFDIEHRDASYAQSRPGPSKHAFLVIRPRLDRLVL